MDSLQIAFLLRLGILLYLVFCEIIKPHNYHYFDYSRYFQEASSLEKGVGRVKYGSLPHKL